MGMRSALPPADAIGDALRMSAAALVFVAVALPGSGCRAVRRRLTAPNRMPGAGGVAEGSGRRAVQTHRRGPGRVCRATARAAALLGRRISAVCGGESDDEALLGVAAVAAAAALALSGPLGGLTIVGVVAWLLKARRRARKRLRELRIERGLPEVIDLLGLVVAAGLPTAAALSGIASRTPEPYRAELSEALRRSAAGEPFVESLQRLRGSLGPSVAPLVYAVTAAEVDGVPLAPALERAGDEAHRQRRVRAEEAARRVPVFMLFPLVFCILPAFCCLTVVPLLVGAMADLRLPG